MDDEEVAIEIAGYRKRLREESRIARYAAFLILRHMDGKKTFLSNPAKLGLLSDEDKDTGSKWKKTTMEDALAIKKYWEKRDRERKELNQDNAINRFYYNPTGT